MEPEIIKSIECSIPYYIFEEIVEYVEETAKRRSRSMKWENIRSLLKCAVVNHRITKQQVEFIEKHYCREKRVKE